MTRAYCPPPPPPPRGTPGAQGSNYGAKLLFKYSTDKITHIVQFFEGMSTDKLNIELCCNDYSAIILIYFLLC